jgi:DivIVA domain-containing protein
VSASFKQVGPFSQGYDPEAVDAFLDRARRSYEDEDDGSFAAEDIVSVDFGVARGGYEMRAVDEALDRLADAFALRDRDRAIGEHGEAEWIRRLTERAQTLQERLERPRGLRFAPGEAGRPAYDRDDVDDLCDRLVGYFSRGEAMSVDDVRRAAFRRRGGEDGYREAVVDVYLDHVADVMASVP